MVRPHRALEGLVAPYVGYAHGADVPPVHLGLPSGWVTLVVSLGGPLEVLGGPGAERGPVRLQAAVGGLHMRSVVLGRRGPGRGVQVAVHPLAVRALLGVGSAELAGTTVAVEDLGVPWMRGLAERSAEAGCGREVFAVVERALLRGLVEGPGAVPGGAVPGEVVQAWRLLSGGARVQEAADRVGWSRRHLAQRFGAEVGLSPKQAARLARFERSTRALRAGAGPLSRVAAECGYADQAHMTNDWRSLAGCTPAQWVRRELPFLQDGAVPEGAG